MLAKFFSKSIEKRKKLKSAECFENEGGAPFRETTLKVRKCLNKLPF